MKTVEEVLGDYKSYETYLDDRFGVRFCSFLTEEQGKSIGFKVVDGEEWDEPKEWTEENVLAQLKRDVEFGWEKACDERGISASLMYEVCKSWCKVLENEFAEFDEYGSYGKPLFYRLAKCYGWELPREEY